MSAPPANGREELLRLLRAGFSSGVEKASLLSGTGWEPGADELQQGAGVPRREGESWSAHLSCRRPFFADVVALFWPQDVAGLARAVAAAGAEAGSPRMWSLPDADAAVLGEFANVLGQGLIRPLADALRASAILSVPKVSRGPADKLLDDAFSGLGVREPLVYRAGARAEAPPCGFEILLVLDAAEIFALLKTAGIS